MNYLLPQVTSNLSKNTILSQNTSNNYSNLKSRKECPRCANRSTY